MGRTWRQIIHFQDLNVCNFKESAAKFPVIGLFVDDLKQHSFVSLECPMKVGKYYGNATLVDIQDNKKKSIDDVLAQKKVKV
jgi:hypothetical protein